MDNILIRGVSLTKEYGTVFKTRALNAVDIEIKEGDLPASSVLRDAEKVRC